MQTVVHNPEAVGSSLTFATIKSPEVVRFRDIFFVLGAENIKRILHLLVFPQLAMSKTKDMQA